MHIIRLLFFKNALFWTSNQGGPLLVDSFEVTYLFIYYVEIFWHDLFLCLNFVINELHFYSILWFCTRWYLIFLTVQINEAFSWFYVSGEVSVSLSMKKHVFNEYILSDFLIGTSMRTTQSWMFLLRMWARHYTISFMAMERSEMHLLGELKINFLKDRSFLDGSYLHSCFYEAL